MLRRGIEKALDLAAARKMLAVRAQHDDPHATVRIGGLERDAQLIALVHRDDVERRPVEDEIDAFARGIDLDPKAVEPVGLCRAGPRGFARRGIGYPSSGIGHRLAPVVRTVVPRRRLGFSWLGFSWL